MKSHSVSVYIVLATLSLVPTSIFAAPSYTVTPLVIDESVKSRDIKQFEINITNTSQTPVTIYPTVNNISIDNGGSIQEFLPAVMSDKTTSIASWIEISRAGMDLFAGQSKSITLTLRIHPQAAPGTYHAFIGFPHGGNRDEAERMVTRGDSPGTVVSVTLEDTRTSLLKLSRFIVDRFVTSVDNSAAAYTIKNPGDEPLVPFGEVIFYDSRGKEVGSVPVNPEKISIPPGGEQAFASGVPADGLFGKYKAFLSVDYGVQNIASVQDTTFFYVFPIRTLIIIVSVLLLIVLIVSLYVHHRYFDDVIEDGSELLPVHVRETFSDPLHHDIDLRKQ